MSRLEIGLLLLAIPLGLVAAGYWLAAALRTASAAERLAVAMLAGLGALTWTVSVVNLALPLGSIWGWACLLPWVAALRREPLRRSLVADLTAVVANRRGALLALGTAVFLGALLWPLLARPDVVYYDGTSGHDGFFWVVGAEHLKRQTYLQPAVTNPVYPLFYSIESIAGLRPVWGRMGAEGLLALLSNLVGASPLKIYVVATAALFFPWVAAVFLVLRTFVLRRINLACALALVLLQPGFVFFQANANLPNLLGALAGAATIVALARALRAEAAPRWPWLVLLALSLHALLCSYPEMLPAIALTGGLLVLRTWWRDGWAPSRAPLAAIALGVALNPITALRAGNGIVSTLLAAAHDPARGSIFDTVPAAARAPAMVALSASVGRMLGEWGGLAGCLVLALAAGFALRRARDRFGTVAVLASGLAILVYTLTRHYPYGWQKTVQFGGVFLAALLPCGVLGHIETWHEPRRRGRAPLALAAVVTGFFGFAGVVHVVDVHKWAGRKFLTRDWFAAREFSRKALHNVPVQVEAETFARPFFYTMWASYFLDESRVYYSVEQASGGYLRPSIEKYPPDWREAPRARLVAGDPDAVAGAVSSWQRGGIGFALLGPRRDDAPKQ